MCAEGISASRVRFWLSDGGLIPDWDASVSVGGEMSQRYWRGTNIKVSRFRAWLHSLIVPKDVQAAWDARFIFWDSRK